MARALAPKMIPHTLYAHMLVGASAAAVDDGVCASKSCNARIQEGILQDCGNRAARRVHVDRKAAVRRSKLILMMIQCRDDVE